MSLADYFKYSVAIDTEVVVLFNEITQNLKCINKDLLTYSQIDIFTNRCVKRY